VVVKLSPDLSQLLYGTYLGGSGLDMLRCIELDAAGSVYAAGLSDSTNWPTRNALQASYAGDNDAVIAKLVPAASGQSVSGSLAGRKLLVRDKSLKPEVRRIVVISNDGGNISAPAPGSSGDPTLGGGLLRIVNPTTGKSDSFTLPSFHWRGNGQPAGSTGYTYKDRDGPCRYARLIAGRILRAVCKGSGIRFSLDEPSQGGLSATLALGAGEELVYCMHFGGTVRRDVGISSARAGRFHAINSPPPTSCP
jgi:hypothetical protein